MEEYSIYIENLTKKRGGEIILNNISLLIPKGKIIGFLGPNGAGKTTTFKCIMNMYSYSGNIFILNKNIARDFKSTISNIGAIIEEPSFYKNLTGFQNLLINSWYYSHIDKEYINNLINTLSMQDYINRKCKTYSLGMKQRLGLAIALINSPSLLLLDEPMNGLDPDGIHDLRVLLKKMSHEEGKTIVISSHLLTEMQNLCDEVIFIKNGSILGMEPVNGLLETRYLKIMKGDLL